MDFIDWAALMMATGGYTVLIQILANISCGAGCNTYLGYYPWIP